MMDDLTPPELQEVLRRAGEAIVTLSALNPLAQTDFRAALSEEEKRFMDSCRAELSVYPAAVASRVRSALWNEIFEALEGAQSGRLEIKVPLGAWAQDARKLGANAAGEILIHAPLAPREYRKVIADYRRKVRRRTQDLLDGWPISPRTRTTIVHVMRDQGDEEFLRVIDRASISTHGNGGVQ
jgi:hypothetical protein